MDDKIIIKDHEDIIEISFEDIKKYHGQKFVTMAAITFKAMQTAFDLLFPDCPASRQEISVLTGHPGQGVRDAFEMVTRAVSRNAYKVDTTLSEGRLNPNADISYSFEIMAADGRLVQIIVKDKVLPERFFELFKLVRQTPNSVTEQQQLNQLDNEFSQLKKDLASEILLKSSSDLFIVRLNAASNNNFDTSIRAY